MSKGQHYWQYYCITRAWLQSHATEENWRLHVYTAASDSVWQRSVPFHDWLGSGDQECTCNSMTENIWKIYFLPFLYSFVQKCMTQGVAGWSNRSTSKLLLSCAFIIKTDSWKSSHQPLYPIKKGNLTGQSDETLRQHKKNVNKLNKLESFVDLQLHSMWFLINQGWPWITGCLIKRWGKSIAETENGQEQWATQRKQR